ncbi:MAG: hypothetical protein IPK28_00740 [Devosia sp.]|nr:hypothetical protein [Devosia sp.]
MVDLLINLSQTPLALAMATSPWVVPTMQSIHIMSIAVIFISVLLIAMRASGYAWAGVSVRQTVARFAPWAWVSLALLALTGIVLILAEPIRELLAVSFWIKMVLLAVTIVISTRFLRGVKREAAYAEVDGPVNPGLRRNAIVTIILLVIIIFMGRFIAYDPLIWGPLSPISAIYAG